MPSLLDMFAPLTGGLQLFEGSVSRAPGTTSDDLFATSPQVPNGQELGPMTWPRDGAFLPSVGARVLIARSDTGATWCIGVER